MSVLLLTATGLEQTRLAEALTGVVSLSVHGRTWRHGVCAGRDVDLVETGLGAVNTAHASLIPLKHRGRRVSSLNAGTTTEIFTAQTCHACLEM